MSHLEIHEWQSKFEANYKLDHEEIISYLAEIANATEITRAATVEGFAEIRALLMYNMQDVCHCSPLFVRTRLIYISRH
jgi:hypothetical protein